MRHVFTIELLALAALNSCAHRASEPPKVRPLSIEQKLWYRQWGMATPGEPEIETEDPSPVLVAPSSGEQYEKGVYDDYTRTVIGGDVIYTAKAFGREADLSRVLAEGQALSALSMECSLPVKGIKIYVSNSVYLQSASGWKTSAKAGVSLDVCEEARKASPDRHPNLINPELEKQLEMYRRLKLKSLGL